MSFCEKWVDMDIGYLLWLQRIRESAGPVVNAIFGFLGSEQALLLALLVPCVVYWCLDKESGHFILMAYGGSSLLNQLIKNTVCCYRPWIRDARVKAMPSAVEVATGYSFPSGHTQSCASMLIGLGWAWRKRGWPLVLGILFTLLVGFSRNYLGVHTPQDVVVGVIEGCVTIWLTDKLLKWAKARPGRDLRLLVGSIVAVIIFLLFATLKPYPMDYVDGKLLVDPHEVLVDCYKVAGCVLGIAFGWFCERHYVGFSTEDVGLRQGLIRLLIGAAFLGVCYAGGKLLTLVVGDLCGQLLRFFAVFFVAMVVVPLVFGRIERSSRTVRLRR